MKKILKHLSSRTRYGISMILIAMLISISSCDSDDDKCTGIDCLPPITETGAGTFGFLVNGEPFVDKSGQFNCFYQLVDGEYFFSISSTNEISNISQIRLSSNMKEIQTNTVFELNANATNEFYAEVNFLSVNGDFTTNSSMDGRIMFHEFNNNSNIVSATFEFEIYIPETQEVIIFSDGRFDSRFTR